MGCESSRFHEDAHMLARQLGARAAAEAYWGNKADIYGSVHPDGDLSDVETVPEWLAATFGLSDEIAEEISDLARLPQPDTSRDPAKVLIGKYAGRNRLI